MDLYSVVIGFLIVVIALGILSYYLNQARNRLQNKVTRTPDIDINGWVKHSSFDIEKLELDLLKLELPNDAKETFIQANIFSFLKRYSKNELLDYCTDIHAGKYNESEIVTIKRCVTASMFLYRFNIPYKLYSTDAVIVIAMAMQMTERIKIQWVFDEARKMLNQKERSYLSGEYLTRNMKALFYLKSLNQYLFSLGADQRPANLIVLKQLIKKSHPGLFQLIGEDNRILCRVLTICCYITGFSIPKDYIYIDDFVLDYIDGKNIFSPKIKPNLKVVN